VLASLNGDGRYGLVLVALAAMLALPCLWNESLLPLLRYDRAGLAAGQYWRLIGAHFVHLDGEHLLLNIAGLTLLWALFARTLGTAGWLAATLCGIASIDAGLWWFSPQVGWYVGASGVLHAIVAAGALRMLQDRDPVAWPTLLLLVGKLGWEQATGAMPFAGATPVVVDSHFYGALGGVVAIGILTLRRKSL
jgi:rhomboid family GlyGly-CTERM serine protease